MLDVLRVLRKMAENSARLAPRHSKDVKEQMSDIQSMLTDMQELISDFKKKGWLKRMWRLSKKAKTLMKLDTRLRRSVDTLMRLYQLAHDADAREQFLEERKYALEAAIEEQVQKRMRERGESEEIALSASGEDPQAICEVVVKAGISAELFQQEISEFRDEVITSFVPLCCINHFCLHAELAPPRSGNSSAKRKRRSRARLSSTPANCARTSQPNSARSTRRWIASCLTSAD